MNFFLLHHLSSKGKECAGWLDSMLSTQHASYYLACIFLTLRNSMNLKPFRHVKFIVKYGSDVFFQGEEFEEREEDL